MPPVGPTIVIGLAAIIAAGPVWATNLTCTGTAPDWRLEITDDSAAFRFPGLTRMDIPHSTRAEGRDWPRAMTLIGPRDTAIVVIHQRDCGGLPFESQVLTQRGQTPILLSGCCAGQP